MNQIPMSLPSKITRFFAAVTVLFSMPGTATSAPVAQSADFSYVVTTQNDPAKPGEAIPIFITITNLTASAQSTQISFIMPNYAYAANYPSGSVYNFGSTTVEAGTSKTLDVVPNILSGASAPPNGTLINFEMRDLSRSITFSRSIEVQSPSEEELKLSCPVGSVAPGSDFIYTLAYHNAGLSQIAGAKLNLKIPAGAAFVSAEAGGAESAGSVVWALGTLDSGENGQVQVRFTAPSSSGPAMLLDARLLDSLDQVVAQASDEKIIASAPKFSYSISTQGDPAGPGEVVPLTVTVTNLTNATQSASLEMVMPNHTALVNYGPGDTYPLTFSNLAAGASQIVTVEPPVASGVNSPPDGTLLNFVVRDPARGASVSRTTVVRSQPAANLKISTPAGTVAPGGTFTYKLTYQNRGGIPVPGAKLKLPVPTGATFGSADSGGTANNGTVEWSLGNLPASKTGQVQVTFIAPPSLTSHLLLDAKLRNGADEILAEASDVKSMATSPLFSYSISTQSDPAGPGQVVPLSVTVTNLTNATQSATLEMVMPNHTALVNYGPGDTYPLTISNLAAGASQIVTVEPPVASGVNSPPDGTLLNFVVRDRARGASFSRTTIVRSLPAANLKLATSNGTVVPGGSFTYTLTYHNRSAGLILGAKLSLPLPTGTTYVSANTGGTLDNGVVQWLLGDLPVSKTGQVQVTFTAPPSLTSHLLIDAKLRNAADEILAEASDVTSMATLPTFSYSISTQGDPAGPGELLPLAVTVTNLTNSVQSASLEMIMPNHTALVNYGPGDTYPVTFSNLPAGASETVTIIAPIASGANSPPEGSILNFVVRHLNRGASVSRSVFVRSLPTADLKLSTEKGSLSSGEAFSYTLSYQNAGTTSILGTKLILAIPDGVTFVSADAGGALVDGKVQWDLGESIAGFTWKVRANFLAPTTSKAVLLMDAKLFNGDGDDELLAHASDIKTIQNFPTFSYELTPQPGVPSLGGTVPYLLKLTNLTNSTQYVHMTYTVPRHTSEINSPSGTNRGLSAVNVAAFASTTLPISLTVKSGTSAPPDSSIIHLIVRDVDRGVSLSHTQAVNRTIYTYGTIIRTIQLAGNLNFGKVSVGQSAIRTLTIKNTGISPLTVSNITFPAGYSGSYAGTITPGSSANVEVTFRPTEGKAYNGNLTIASDKTDGGSQMPLTGTGASRFIKLGGNLNFGKVLVFSKKTLVLTISNPGNDPLTVTKLTLPAGYKASFAGVVAAGQTKQIPVTFQPAKRQKYEGKLTVICNKNQGVNTVSLAGQGK